MTYHYKKNVFHRYLGDSSLGKSWIFDLFVCFRFDKEKKRDSQKRKKKIIVFAFFLTQILDCLDGRKKKSLFFLKFLIRIFLKSEFDMFFYLSQFV
jgi:hypothetical protein